MPTNENITIMKLSKYNYYIKDKESFLWFNSITQRFFYLNNEISEKVLNTLNNDINYFRECSPKFFNKLKDYGFIIEKGVDEIETIRELNNKIVNSKNYSLIILPTLNCNFSCWYCVQDHIETKMSQDTVSNIKKHIQRMIVDEKISSLNIEWFGGEPFLYFNDIIKPLSIFAITLCKKHDIPFTSSATTNGYYLNENVSEFLEELNFRHFQISIDGIRKQHNKVKKAKKGISAYDTTLNNINRILSTTKNINILLRFNYSVKNLNEEIVEEINKIISPINRKKVEIVFRRIWQVKVDTNLSGLIIKLINAFINSGFRASQIDIDNAFITCYTDRKYYNAINYNGNIVKCTANDDIYSDAPPGKLQKDGTIVWKEGFLKKFYKKRFENKLCLKCKELPLCMGDCGKDYEAEVDSELKVYCVRNLDLSYEELILNYCKLSSKL